MIAHEKDLSTLMINPWRMLGCRDLFADLLLLHIDEDNDLSEKGDIQAGIIYLLVIQGQ
jgi:hypothetical protein